MSKLSEWNALVSCSAANIDDSLRSRPEMVSEVLVNHMSPNPTAERGVVAVHERLREWSPVIRGRSVAHLTILAHPTEP